MIEAVPSPEEILEAISNYMEPVALKLARLTIIKKQREDVIKEIEVHKKKNSEKGERYSVKGKKHNSRSVR